MKSAAKAYKLQLIKKREFSGKEVAIASVIAARWGSTGDITVYADYARCTSQVLELADAETLRSIAEKYLANPENSGYGIYVSVPGELEKKNADKEARLVQMKADMSDEDKAALIARTQDFAQ